MTFVLPPESRPPWFCIWSFCPMALALCFSIGSLKIVLFFDLPEHTVRDKANPESREIGHFSRSKVTKYTIHKCPFFFLVFTETWFSWITLESLFYRDHSFSHDLTISDSGSGSTILMALRYHCQALRNTLFVFIACLNGDSLFSFSSWSSTELPVTLPTIYLSMFNLDSILGDFHI